MGIRQLLIPCLLLCSKWIAVSVKAEGLGLLGQLSGQSQSNTVLDCSSLVSSSTYTTTGEPYQSRLHGCFLNNEYDTSQVPLQQSASTTYLSLNYSFAVVNLLEFDNGRIKMFYQLALQWYDFHRQWNYSQIPVKFIEVPLTELWYPRFKLINTDVQESVNLVNGSLLHAQIYYNSLITVYVNDILEGVCDVDLTNFPFDTQKCELTIRFDRYFFDSVDVVLARAPTTYKFDGITNDEWDYIGENDEALNYSVNTYSVYDNGSLSATPAASLSNFQTGFKVSITLKRYVNYYMVTLVWPIILLTLLGFVTFMVDETSEQKVEVPFTVVLGFMFVQGIVATLIPKSNRTPLLAWYVLSSIFLAIVTVLLGLVCSIVHNVPGSPAPLIGRALVDWLGFPVQPSRWVGFCSFCKLKLGGGKKRDSIAPIVPNQRGDSDSAIARSHSSLERIELQDRTSNDAAAHTTTIDETHVETIALPVTKHAAGTSSDTQAPPYESISPPPPATYETADQATSASHANSLFGNDEPKMLGAFASPLPYSEAVRRPASRGSSAVSAWPGNELNDGHGSNAKTPYTWEEVANVLNRIFGVFYVFAALGLFFGLLFPILLPQESA